MSFYSSPLTGQTVTGDSSKAFLQDFTIIPNNTTAVAAIKGFELVEKEATIYGPATQFYNVTYKICAGDFKGREVSQKIKTFDGKPEAIDRNLNMLRLIMNLCEFKPTHSNAPSTSDLAPMLGKVIGIKIREWSMPKADGSGIAEGNFVSEVHSAVGFECVTGEKMEVVSTPPHSALQRNQERQSSMTHGLLEDIPF